MSKIKRFNMHIAFLSRSQYPNSIGGGEVRYHDVKNSLIKQNFQISHLNINETKSYFTRFIYFPIKILIDFMRNRYDIIEMNTEVAYLYPLCVVYSIIRKTKIVILWHEYFGKRMFNLNLPILLKTIAYVFEFIMAKHGKYHLCISEFTANRLKKHIWKNGSPHLNKVA